MGILKLLNETLASMQYAYDVSSSKPSELATHIRKLKKGIDDLTPPAHTAKGDAINPIMNPWHPMTDPVDLKVIGKFLEELGEATAAAAAARCQIQGIDECEPVTGKPNREWLEDELADVMAGTELAIERFNLDRVAIRERAERKKDQLRTWHRMA